MQLFYDVVLRFNGTPAVGATVTVTNEDGTAATLYEDNGVTPYPSNVLTADGNGAYQFFAANGTYTVVVAYGNAPAQTRAGIVLYDPEDDLNEQLMAWALSQTFRLVSGTRNSDGALTSASIQWPDGTLGTFTATALSTAFPGAIDAWTATYGDQTITQPAVTRDASTGAVTVQPALTIA